MSLAWLNPFNKVADIIDKAVVDKDQKIALTNALEQLKEQVYMKELDTKTVPWVDAVHKMGRQIISLVNIIAGVAIMYMNPEVDPLSLAAVLGAGGIYNAVKGKGK
jgi:hypothetical protein